MTLRSVQQLRDVTIEELLEAVFLCRPLRGHITRRTKFSSVSAMQWSVFVDESFIHSFSQ
jgi:hypothetical protein